MQTIAASWMSSVQNGHFFNPAPVAYALPWTRDTADYSVFLDRDKF